MHIGSVLSGQDTGNANTDLKMSILPIWHDGGRVRTQGQQGRFFDVWRPSRGLLQGHIRGKVVWDAYWKCSEWFGCRKCEY